MRRYVTKKTDILLTVLRPAEQQHIINRRHQTLTFSDTDILLWNQIIAVLIANAGKGFIKKRVYAVVVEQSAEELNRRDFVQAHRAGS